MAYNVIVGGYKPGLRPPPKTWNHDMARYAYRNPAARQPREWQPHLHKTTKKPNREKWWETAIRSRRLGSRERTANHQPAISDTQKWVNQRRKNQEDNRYLITLG